MRLALRPGRGRVSALVAAFASLRDADRNRPLIHLPAVHQSLTADDVWRAHGEYANRLSTGNLRPGHLILLATGNRPPVAGLLLAARALGLAVMPVDAGTTVSEVLELSARFGASAIVSASSSSADVTGRRVPLAENLDLIFVDGATPVEYR